MVAAALALGACDAGERPVTGAAPPAEQGPAGRCEGTGVLVSGVAYAGTAGVSFPVAMTVASGQARMPLRGGGRGLVGPVATDGSLAGMRWEGDSGVTGESRGRVADGRFALDYVHDWPEVGAPLPLSLPRPAQRMSLRAPAAQIRQSAASSFRSAGGSFSSPLAATAPRGRSAGAAAGSK